jgi:WD40 repeat protein
VRDAAFSPDGRRVVTASGSTAYILSLETGRTIMVLEGHTFSVNSVAFSPDGRRVLTSSLDKTARIWDTETGKVTTILIGHTDSVLKATFSSDGRRIATASFDKSARIWDARTGKTIAALTDFTNELVVSAELSPDDHYVLTASVDATRIWPLFSNTQDLIDKAKQEIPRCLTLDQRESLYLDSEPPAWCIEMKKWPYQTQGWKDWLHFKRSNANPPLPDTPEWQQWIAAHPVIAR